jgi:non-ribosomal peptide synthetase component F
MLRDYPGTYVTQFIEAQVERTPDAVAVEFEGQQLSYRELNERANRLAHHLMTRGAGPEALVAVCLERSAELVVTLLGVLCRNSCRQAGCQRLAPNRPLDPAFRPSSQRRSTDRVVRGHWR